MACSFTAAQDLEGAESRIRRCWWWQRSLGDKKVWEEYFSWMENLYFHLLLSLHPKCFHNLETQLFQMLITRQSYSQQMSHYNINQQCSPISARNSQRIPGLSLAGDSELTVWEIFFISTADMIRHWWSEYSVFKGKKRHLCLQDWQEEQEITKSLFFPSQMNNIPIKTLCHQSAILERKSKGINVDIIILRSASYRFFPLRQWEHPHEREKLKISVLSILTV